MNTHKKQIYLSLLNVWGMTFNSSNICHLVDVIDLLLLK